MRQTSATEKIDPLMRIQEEIKEVKRREQEYRQLKSVTSGDLYDEHNNDDDNNGNHTDTEHRSISPIPAVQATSHMVAVVTSLAMPAADDSSLASSVNSKEESLDENHHSDDSGISASSSPINGTSANEPSKPLAIKEQRYIGPNTYNLTPVPPPQKLLTRATSTPQIFTQHRIIAHSSAQKGLMQRFIASRGKIMLNNNGVAGGNKMILNNMNYNGYSNSNGKHVELTNGNGTPTNADPDAAIAAAVNTSLMAQDFNARSNVAIIPTVTMTPPIIERDADGKPIRRGYIPVEVKIQRELKDYKSRESELKKYRKIRESTPDLLDSIAMENLESDDDDSEVEHCYGPGKLRSAKSISELCDSTHNNNSISQSNTPSPDFEFMCIKPNITRSNGMRPAMSLAQLCDLTPEEAPSSHRLIAQWENIIKQHEIKAERE